MSDTYRKELELLKDLQKIDVKLHRLEVEQTEIPEQIGEAEKAYEEVKTSYDAAKAEFDVATQENKLLEEELTKEKQQVKKRDAKLYTVSNNREYQAIVREISEIKRANREREEKILALMEQIEILEPTVKKFEAELKEKEEAVKKVSEGTEERLKEIASEITEIEKDRPAILEQLDKKILRRYDFIRQRSPDALVPVTDGTCGGCHTKIPHQLYNEILRNNEFKECPMCRRLLFVEIKKENEEEQTAEAK